MKFGFVILKKNQHAITRFKGSGIDVAMMGAALMAESANIIAKEKNISVDYAFDMLLDSCKKCKPTKTK